MTFELLASILQQPITHPPSVWDELLGNKSQTLATWIYTFATIWILIYIVRQFRQTKEQIKHVEDQLRDSRAARDLESFKTFVSIWDSDEVRRARRYVYEIFEKPVKLKITDEIASNAEFERIIGTMDASLRQSVEAVINKSNLVGLLWCEGFFQESMRKIVLPYVYKTTIVTWDCLCPYIMHVRSMRREVPGASITFAAPFEALLKEAEHLLKERNEQRPLPSRI